MAPAVHAGAAAKSGKAKKMTYTIDCSKPVEDKIMELDAFGRFLKEKVKVNGKAGALGDSVEITLEKSRVLITTRAETSKR